MTADVDEAADRVLEALDRAGVHGRDAHELVGFYVGWMVGVDLATSPAERDGFWVALVVAGLERVPLGRPDETHARLSELGATPSETGDPYVPVDYAGPLARCGDCGWPAPATALDCPHPGHDGVHPMCEPCRLGSAEVHGVDLPRPATVPLRVADRVRVVSHYTWCGQDSHGWEGVVATLDRYPAGIVDGDAVYTVRVPGRGGVPLTRADLEWVAP